MATDIMVPALGESVTEATVAQWLKKPGEAVRVDEALVELETDKVTLEVNATIAGVLSEVLAAEGDNVEVGAVLGRIAEGAGAPAAAKPAAEAVPSAATPEAAEPATAAPAPAAAPGTTPSAAPDAAEKTLSPAVRKLIDDNGLDPRQIPGTGKDGRLLKADVLDFLEGRAPAPGPAVPVAPPAAEPGAREERVRMTRLRKRIAERLK
ncbi:MAG: biotin/lipoyl-containing protein, partial [Kiloniellaceae bacterium]